MMYSLGRQMFRKNVGSNVFRMSIPAMNASAGAMDMTMMMHMSTNKTPKTPEEGTVTIAQAKSMPRLYRQMSNDVLITMAVMGDQDAREERLIREIMAVDNVTWEGAQPTFKAIVASNKRGLFFSTLPYKIGIASALLAGVASVPMVFEINTVLWFNELYVTTDVPEEKDLETALEVGSFAWNWMEPPLGTISFVLLCFQYARSQLENLGIKPYTSALLHRRANRVIAEFPKYNPAVIRSYSEGDPLSGENCPDEAH